MKLNYQFRLIPVIATSDFLPPDRPVRCGIFPAYWPPLRKDGNAQMDGGAQIELHWDLAAQPEPNYEGDQRISWKRVEAATLMRSGVGLWRSWNMRKKQSFRYRIGSF